ncbi:5-(carboxyamino)imidazole ribonucleotide synthase [Aliihoeflea aestuarii]|uniref:5-(carboxyamino)imidazole ribonucleotide synthase n=1 Tax=Aliihoeflea aestuarii TaxID=453840 RepID=UPI002091E5E0|nr:5-(carboxyamino)imidazole ribonucleotide synthase [Aliihoeflea aestuarii]MCO6391364.1 5-(carboxyamino)imidazole ribonucleotide synthase [Aliihoeflea aestuarii]
MSALKPGSTIGIIGGGQLGRMLAMAAARLGYRTVVLDPQGDCPAAQVANEQIVAAYDDAHGLARLGSECEIVTYEFENVPVEAAKSLGANHPVFPPPRALEMAQDRLTEKQFLNDAGIATAPFKAVDSNESLADALAVFGGSGVLKTRRLGYDGKGQKVFRDAGGDQTAGVYEGMGSVPLILEGFVPFSTEISVVAARNAQGTKAAFDASENLHQGGILKRSTVPAHVQPKTLSAARAATLRILDALDYVGVIGVEFFVLGDGSVIANEMAPRVHNSGHWTEAACAVSQFEQHIRAICGLPLGNTARHSDCVMENLIGDDLDEAERLAAEPGLVLHLYGKTDARPGRKMGHFTRISRKS